MKRYSKSNVIINVFKVYILLGYTYKDDTQSLVTDSPDAQSLGPAQDSANFLSRFTFFWVNSLIDKGVAGRLNQVDDLFQLPASIQVVQLAQRMREAIAAAPTLFWALHKAHGVEFYSIGLLRFVSDVAGFAGPLLLGGLLSHTTVDAQDAGSTFDGAPYWYAFGLFATTMICKSAVYYYNSMHSELCLKIYNFSCAFGNAFRLARCPS